MLAMVDTLQELTLTGECEGRLWWVGYVCPYRYVTTAIELETAPGQWVSVPNFEFTIWASREAMLAAIELRLRAYLAGVQVVHASTV
jgi:hypothetical protein